MFLGWLIEKGLVSETFHVDEEFSAACAEFRSRAMSGPRLYCELLDGVLTDDDLSEEGNRFVNWYINKYYDDFSETLFHHGKNEGAVSDLCRDPRLERAAARISGKVNRRKLLKNESGNL